MRGDTEMTAQVVYAQVCFYIVWEGGYNGGTMGNVYPKMVYDSPSSFQDFSEHFTGLQNFLRVSHLSLDMILTAVHNKRTPYTSPILAIFTPESFLCDDTAAHKDNPNADNSLQQSLSDCT